MRDSDGHLVIKKKQTQEDEFFARQEREHIEKARGEKEKADAERSVRERRELHFMKCPKCGNDLEEIEFKDIMVDRCTGCRGVWLDAGELKTILEREARMVKSLFKSFFADRDFDKLEK